MASMRVCDALLPELATTFSVSTGQAAQSISFFVIAYGLLQLVYGTLGDRVGKQRLITLAVALSALINLLIALAPDITTLALLRALAGGAAAGIIPLSMAFIGDTVQYAERQTVLARFMTATITGMILGQWMGGLFADTLGWQAAFLVLSALFASVALGMWLAGAARRPPGSTGTRARFSTQLKSVLAVPWARRILLFVGLEGALVFSAIVFIPSFLHHRFGLSLSAAGASVAVYGLGGLGYTLFARRLLARFGEHGLVRMGGLLMGAGFLMLVLAPNALWSVPSCLMGGFGFYMLHNTLQANATQMVPSARGTAVSLFACSLFLGQSAGIAGTSFVVDQLDPAHAFTASLVLLPLLGLWIAHDLAHKKTAQEPH
ncbi:MAG: MFS transporter [Alcaligenaceae bacterium]|nr:MFS transporter [Alcaligenaceae bacterium]